LLVLTMHFFFFFSSRRRHTRFDCDWSSDVCSSDLFVRNAQSKDRAQELHPSGLPLRLGLGQSALVFLPFFSNPHSCSQIRSPDTMALVHSVLIFAALCGFSAALASLGGILLRWMRVEIES